MAEAMVEAIGAAGAVLTTVCWVPQAVKIIRDRDTRAISLPGTTLCVIGVLLWLIYGLAIVERVPLQTMATKHNIAYLRTKKEKLGHKLSGV